MLFVHIPKTLPEGVLEPLITSLLSHAIYSGPVASCFRPLRKKPHRRITELCCKSHLTMPVWQMDGMKDRRSRGTGHMKGLFKITAISIGPQSSQWLKKKRKNTEANKRTCRTVERVSSYTLRYWSIGLLIPTAAALLNSPSDVPGTPGTLAAVPRVIKAVLCAPVVVNLMVHKWRGLLGFPSHLQPHMAPTFLSSHTHSERLLGAAQ